MIMKVFSKFSISFCIFVIFKEFSFFNLEENFVVSPLIFANKFSKNKQSSIVKCRSLSGTVFMLTGL